jgi:hypothetical protein
LRLEFVVATEYEGRGSFWIKVLWYREWAIVWLNFGWNNVKW